MFLKQIESLLPPNQHGDAIRQMQTDGVPVPQILHLLAFKPEANRHLEAFTRAVMRGPSPLTPGQREFIAAFTSKLNQCLF